jgi:hypothetical protein
MEFGWDFPGLANDLSCTPVAGGGWAKWILPLRKNHQSKTGTVLPRS